MKRQRVWVLMTALLAVMMLFTACDQLLNQNGNNEGVIGPVDNALAGKWVLYSSTDNQSVGSDYYAGIVFNSDGNGVHYELTFGSTGNDSTSVNPFQWSAENNVLHVELTNPPAGQPSTFDMSYVVDLNGNRLTVNGTDGGTSYTEVYIKIATQHDGAVVGDWIVVSPTEEAGARITLSSGGTGSYTSVDSSDVQSFTWATNSNYIGILLFNDVAGFIAGYSVSGDQITLTMGDGSTMVLQRDTGGGETNDLRLIGRWVLYSSPESAGEGSGDYYAGLMINGDGTGAHYSVYYDNEGNENTSSDPFQWSSDNGVLHVELTSPPPDAPATMDIPYTLDLNSIRLTLNVPDSSGTSSEVYIKFGTDRDGDAVGDWIVVSPTDELGARITLSSDGSGSYASADGSEVTNFTWVTNSDFIALLLYNDVAGFAAEYSVSGDQVTLTMGDGGTMVLQRDTGGGTIDTDLVGTWFLYMMDTNTSSTMTNRGVRIPRALTGTSDVVYGMNGTLILNDDGTGVYRMYEDDGMGGKTLYEQMLGWEVVVPGLLSVTITDNSGTQTAQVGYSVDGEELTLHIQDMAQDQPAADETYIRFSDDSGHRPSDYYGTFIMSDQHIINGPQPDQMPYMQMTLILNADDGTMYQHMEMWDQMNQQPVVQDTVEQFVWCVSGNHFLQADPTTMVGQVVDFTFEETPGGSAHLVGTTWEWFWDEMNQTDMMLEVETEFYRFSGGNDSNLEGTFASYSMVNTSQEMVPGPQMNVTLNLDGTGTYIGMEWDEEQQRDVLKQDSFHWFTSDGMFLVLSDPNPYPFGQVFPYALNGDMLDLINAGPQDETVLLTMKSDEIDNDAVGSWVEVARYYDGMPQEPDPNAALMLQSDHSGSYTGTVPEDSSATHTDAFTWFVNPSHTYVLVDLQEPDPDPQVMFYMAMAYMYDSGSGHLSITSYEPDQDGAVHEVIEEFAPAP